MFCSFLKYSISSIISCASMIISPLVPDWMLRLDRVHTLRDCGSEASWYNRWHCSWYTWLSNQQVCIITAIQRFGHTVARTLNYGKPSSLDLLRFGEYLESKSFVILDGSNSYNELLESKNCTKKVLISHESYDKFNHLNTVNSFHKLIEERLQKYKGVASKYINRYNALFIMQRETQGMDNTEKLQYVQLRLKNIYKITRLKDLKNEWLFA